MSCHRIVDLTDVKALELVQEIFSLDDTPTFKPDLVNIHLKHVVNVGLNFRTLSNQYKNSYERLSNKVIRAFQISNLLAIFEQSTSFVGILKELPEISIDQQLSFG